MARSGRFIHASFHTWKFLQVPTHLRFRSRFYSQLKLNGHSYKHHEKISGVLILETVLLLFYEALSRVSATFDWNNITIDQTNAHIWTFAVSIYRSNYQDFLHSC